MTKRTTLYFILRRLFTLALLLIVISFLVFSLIYLAPGNTVDTLLGANPRTPETVHALREKYHLNDSFLQQYWTWAKDALHLNFGDSTASSLPVTDEINRRWPTSLFLGVYAFVLTMIFGVLFGMLAAFKRNGIVDRSIVAASVIGLSTPVFVGGIFLLYVFAIRLGWFPVFGQGTGTIDRLWHLTLPAVALTLTIAAFLVKHTRAAMIGVLEQDYIVFARARGLSATRIVFRYALRNALIPIVTISGIIFSYLIVGAVLAEVTFSLAGIGRLLVSSATVKDLPTIQGVVMLVAVVIMVVNLLTDLVYMAIDPRIRHAGRTT